MATAPAITFLALLLASCANYDFRKARTPDGTPDMQKLIADLAASGEDSLSDGVWIPLVYCNITRFGKTTPDLPSGYSLNEITAIGPVFCLGSNDETTVDEKGAPIESFDRWWLGWGLLLHDYDERVVTSHGDRYHGRFRWLGVFGKDTTHYVGTNREADEARPPS